MEERPTAIQRPSADDAFGKLRQIAHQPGHPKLEIRDGHPDIGSAQLSQHRERKPENIVVSLTVRQQLIQQLGYVAQRDCPRITYFKRQRRLQNFAGIQPRQLLPLTILIISSDEGQGLERPAKPSLGFLGRARYPAYLAFQSGE